MKGVLFNVIEEVVESAMSPDEWDDVIEAAGVSGAYTSLGNYPDADLDAIVRAVGAAAGLSIDDTLRLAGRLGFERLAARAPSQLARCATWRDVLTTLDDIIHPEVLKAYPDAELPQFDVVSAGDDITMRYTSARRMCALADGLIVGCGTWYGSVLTVRHETCVHRGDPTCTLRVAETP